MSLAWLFSGILVCPCAPGVGKSAETYSLGLAAHMSVVSNHILLRE